MFELKPDWHVASPPQLARRYTLHPSKILDFIRGGELRAANIARAGKRPRYLIKREDFDDFWRSRSEIAAPEPPQPTRKRKSSAKQYV